MPDPDSRHVQQRPIVLLQPPAGVPRYFMTTSSSSGNLKRKNIESEATNSYGKRTRDVSSRSTSSNTSSHRLRPETILEAESESTPLPRTSVGQEFAAEPVTPTTSNPPDPMITSRAGDQQQTRVIATPNTPPKPSENLSLSSAMTPFRISSSNVDPCCVPPSHSSSQTSRGSNVASAPPSQRSRDARESNGVSLVAASEMEDILMHELRGQVFEHQRFADEFFELKPDVQARVRALMTPEKIKEHTPNLHYDQQRDTWVLGDTITLQENESKVYDPLAGVLNAIGHAAFQVYHKMHYPDGGDSFRGVYRPFHNHSSRAALRDSPNDTATKPDLVKGSLSAEKATQSRAHWGDMELVIECKSSFDTNSRNEAFMQLARYAWAVFAHQLYRIRVFGFSLCGSIVNWVCFDRSGLLHSSDIDLSTSEGANSFVQQAISLLTIPTTEFGYDTRYSFREREGTVDTVFHLPEIGPRVVTEVICYRKCCSGRATCVCGLDEGVHKGIWRPEDQPDEGETLDMFKGVFAVCQVTAHDCSTYSTRLKYPDSLKESPAASYFLHRGRVNLANGSTTTSSGNTGSHTSREPLETSVRVAQLHPPISRGVRVKSDIIMPRGTSIFEAQNPLHLHLAIHDALMGIMALTEAGKVHRDISAYNLLLVNPERHYHNQNWLASPEGSVSGIWKRTASGTRQAASNNCSSSEPEKSEYVCPRLKRVKALRRGPYCVVHDTELIVDEDQTQNEVRTNHTGTPAFISARLLERTYEGSPQPLRTFIDDAESLFWVLIWLVANRSQKSGSWSVNEAAKTMIRSLTDNNMHALSTYKSLLVTHSITGRLKRNLLGLENDWAEDLTPVIVDLGKFFNYSLYCCPPTDQESTDGEPTDVVPNRMDPHWYLKRELDKYMNESRDATFARLFSILDSHTERLEKKYTVDMGQL